jgi:hypothetical protein
MLQNLMKMINLFHIDQIHYKCLKLNWVKIFGNWKCGKIMKWIQKTFD